MTVRFSRFLHDRQVIRHPRNPSTPLVSVIMPTYRLKPGELNQRAIESVLSQSFTDFEFIIVDDGSIDGLYQVLLDYQSRDSRIVLVRHNMNSGLPAVRVNEGLFLARGKYVAYMFDDDQWLPGGLAHLAQTILASPDECLVYGAVEWTIHRPDGPTERRTLGEWDFNYALLKNSNKIANCAVLHPKTVLDKCGLYDPHVLLRRSCDYDLWLRMAKVVPFRRCPHIVGRVTAGTRYAIGATVGQDLALTCRYLETDRNARLMPQVIADYEVDSLGFVADPVEANRIREHYVIPFWEQHPAWLTPAERKRVLASRACPNRLLVTKGDYSTSVDVTLGNFARLLDTDVQSLGFLQERSLAAATRWNYDTLVLYRTIAAPSLRTLTQARQQGKSVVYLMDDNMFRFGTGYLAEEYAYLKPGSPGFQVLGQEVAASDLVFSYSPLITADCLEFNPRVIELRTNIQEQYIRSAEPPEGAKSGRKLKYAILTGLARKQELKALHDEIEKFAVRHKDDIEFHIWGMEPQDFSLHGCTVLYRRFDHSYESYLGALSREKFDFVLCPLFDDHETKISKSPIKYLEATAAGAVGIYSDMAVYQVVKHGVTGLKVSNQSGDWLQGLESSLELADEERRSLHAAAKAHVLEEFATESQLLEYLTAFEAADLHAALTSHSSPDGRAAIAFFFHESLLGGATLHLLQHALIANSYRFRPILCFPKGKAIEPSVSTFAETRGFQVEQLDFVSTVWHRDPAQDDYGRAAKLKIWFQERDVRLVHMVTFMADVALAAREAGLPLVATLHQYYDSPTASAAQSSKSSAERLVSAIHSSSLRYAWKWQEALQTRAFCIRAPISKTLFADFESRRQRQTPAVPTLVVSGTLQPRKGQLKAIQVVGALAEQGIRVKLILMGYTHLLPDYVSKCQQAIHDLGLENQVTIVGFAEDPRRYYQVADYLLCSSEDESFPQSILKAMASGIRVITTPVGGVTELVQDGVSGVVAEGMETTDLVAAIRRALEIPPTQWQRMLENARCTAGMACSEEVAAYKLLKLYDLAARENSMSGQSQSTARVSEAEAQHTLAEARSSCVTIEEPPAGELAEAWAVLCPTRDFRLRPPADNLVGLNFRLDTPNPLGAGHLLCELVQNGQVIRQERVDLSKATLDSWTSIRFNRVHHSKNVPFTFRATVQNSPGTMPVVSIYEYISVGPWAQTNLLRRARRWLLKRFFSSRRLACYYVCET